MNTDVKRLLVHLPHTSPARLNESAWTKAKYTGSRHGASEGPKNEKVKATGGS